MKALQLTTYVPLLCQLWTEAASGAPIDGPLDLQTLFVTLAQENSSSISHLTGCPDLCTALPTQLNTSSLGAFEDSVPPDDFAVDSWYRPDGRGQDFRKLDVFIASINALVVAAHSGFDDIAQPTTFSEMPRVTIRCGGRFMKVKHFMWAVYIMVKWMEEQNRYEEAKFKVMIGAQLFGVGEYFKTPYGSEEGATTAAANDTVTVEQSIQKRYPNQIISTRNTRAVKPQNVTSTSTDQTATLSTSRRPQLAIDITFLGDNAYRPENILRAIMKMIIDTAQYEITDPNRGLVYYDEDSDFFFLVRATSEANIEKLKCYIVIYVLQTIAGEMADSNRWTEFYGRIRWVGEIVGLIALRAGKPPLAPGADVEGLTTGETSHNLQVY